MSHPDLMKWPIFSLLDLKFIRKIHMAMVFGYFGDKVLIVTKDDLVYAIGSSTTGSLNPDNATSTLEPCEIQALSHKHVIAFALGNGPHVLALTNKGQVYCWEYNGFCKLGIGKSFVGSFIPMLVTSNLGGEFVIDIACGDDHSLALTKEGKVYAWGQNSYGQVGILKNEYEQALAEDQETPQRVTVALVDKKVISIACSQNSSMAVTDTGEVFGWGYNRVGQLGIGNCINQLTPCKIMALSGIVIGKVVCGYAHVLALSDEGELYVWGKNSYGELGLGNKLITCSPTKLSSSEMGRVSDIAASRYSHISIAVGENGVVFMWGQCRGQNLVYPKAIPMTNLHDVFAYYSLPTVTHQPLIFHDEKDVDILDCLKQAFDDPDLTIEVQGKPIHVHKSVLKIRCEHFRTMFQEHWPENSQSVLKLDQFSYDVYKSFLRYLYTNEVNVTLENALKLFNLANGYVETQLMKRCISIIKQGITVSNAAAFYHTAIVYNVEELEKFCFKFILNHMIAVVQTENFVKLDKAMLNKFLIEAASVGAFKT